MSFNIKSGFVLCCALLIAIAPHLASAANLSLCGGTTCFASGSRDPVSPMKMVADFYDLALMVSGLLAFGMIVLGAIIYTVSAGNPSKQSDARDRIWQAFLGLILLFGAYMILKIINPRLTTLKIGAPPTSMRLDNALAHTTAAIYTNGKVAPTVPNTNT